MNLKTFFVLFLYLWVFGGYNSIHYKTAKQNKKKCQIFYWKILYVWYRYLFVFRRCQLLGNVVKSKFSYSHRRFLLTCPTSVCLEFSSSSSTVFFAFIPCSTKRLATAWFIRGIVFLSWNKFSRFIASFIFESSNLRLKFSFCGSGRNKDALTLVVIKQRT